MLDLMGEMIRGTCHPKVEEETSVTKKGGLGTSMNQ